MSIPSTEIAGLWGFSAGLPPPESAVAAPPGGLGGAGIWLAFGMVAVGLGILLVFALHLRTRIRGTDRSIEAAGDDQTDRFAAGEVLADLDELSRRLAEELEHKAARLERLIAEADARIEQLEPVVRRTAAAPANGADSPDPLNAQVYEMADRGCSAVEIAQTLGQHAGKVELILALRR